eukprot:m.203940 g.203940  ORF g.203940 m.203940 type:complete len:819 (+) comp18865_c0_seq8:159-2615(+)
MVHPLWLVVSIAPVLAAETLVDIDVTPWCDNSMRVVVSPSSSSLYGDFSHIRTTKENLQETLKREGLSELPGALVSTCGVQPGQKLNPDSPSKRSGNLDVALNHDGSLTFSRVDTKKPLFTAEISLTNATTSNVHDDNSTYLQATVTLTAADPSERVYGLGQGGWTGDGGCPLGEQVIVPLERNGQTLNLHQRKFHVTIPYVYSTAGYGFLYNMPGYGKVSIGAHGTGGMVWTSTATLAVDVWVSAPPAAVSPAHAHDSVYHQYADATGHAPLLREDAMLFWQSRNRYRSSAIALSVADRYQQLDLPVGVLVIDYRNQVHDGDFAPDPACYPSVQDLSAGIRDKINASTVFSFWPEVLADSAERTTLTKAGCLSNADLGGLVVDSTKASCRDLIWKTMLKPRYYDQGVSAYWLDETDGEGTGGGDGEYGYDTSLGPARFASNLWVNSWLQMFSEPVAQAGDVAPLLLTRGTWAGGQRSCVLHYVACVFCILCKCPLCCCVGACCMVGTCACTCVSRMYCGGVALWRIPGVVHFFAHVLLFESQVWYTCSTLVLNHARCVQVHRNTVCLRVVHFVRLGHIISLPLWRVCAWVCCRYGIVLWSSDIWSTFEELAAMVPQGVHASLSGIPWWTTDVGGYGCGNNHPNDSPYMQELIVRWYQFGTFCPVFRTHGCRQGPSEPLTGSCHTHFKSCGENEVWSYGNATQKVLEKFIRVRETLKPYIGELAANVSARGVPTMRPLWWNFPEDAHAVGITDQYMLGDRLLVAPVTLQNATSRAVYFPGDVSVKWQNYFNASEVHLGGHVSTVAAPLDSIPVFHLSA